MTIINWCGLDDFTVKEQSMKKKLESKKGAMYLNVPVNPAAEEVHFCVYADGVNVDEQKLPISSNPVMWAPLPLGGYSGREITVEISGEHVEDKEDLLELMVFSDRPHDWQTVRKEPLRPLIHFTPKRGFMNDPNGLFYYDGVYHMFFQHNPYSITHGNTHWGHAVSSDLLHWEELEPAILPDHTDGLIFSGSAVVDYNNTSGLKEGEHPPILLFYTATGLRFRPKFHVDPETQQPILPEGWVRPGTKQCISVSRDGGKTFEKYGGNPVVDEICPMNRDPKLVWNRDTESWVMSLYLRDNDFTLLYSDDLLSWEQGQIITLEASGECPDIFEMYVDDDRSNRKWVICVSPENYIVGHFSGREFIAETDLIKGPTQGDGEEQKAFLDSPAYAAQTFFDTAGSRVLQMSWITTYFPGTTFFGCMSLPLELKLITTPDGLRMSKQPAEEVKGLRGDSASTLSITADVATNELSSVSGEALELLVQADMREDGILALSVRGVLILYNHSTKTLYFPTGKYVLPVSGKALDLNIFVDAGSVELFACNGLFNCVLNSTLNPGKRTVEILDTGATNISMELHKLADTGIIS